MMAVGLVDCWRVAGFGVGKKADERAHCMRGQGTVGLCRNRYMGVV